MKGSEGGEEELMKKTKAVDDDGVEKTRGEARISQGRCRDTIRHALEDVNGKVSYPDA